VTETVATTEQLLAAWREAQRILDALDPYTPGRADVEARVDRARAAYRAHVAAVENDSTADSEDWASFPEVVKAG
jgi:hypothetical protein